MLASLTAPHQPLARWRSRLAPAIADGANHVRPRRGSPPGSWSRSPDFRRRLDVMWEAGR